MVTSDLSGYLMATIPHSGEDIPPEAKWLQDLDELTLMGDVDRFVDKLYEPSLAKLNIPYVKTQWHRYAADLNRLDSDIDSESVLGNSNPAGTYPRGFHWVYSTQNEKILHEPLTLEIHQQLVNRVFNPFHKEVRSLAQSLLSKDSKKNLYHVDLHSMPSRGTTQHRDPGKQRKDIVISDSKGKSCSLAFKDLVMESFKSQGFSLSYNWPYFGGRLTEHYGHPEKKHHVIQIELNRALYMSEVTKQLNSHTEDLMTKLFETLREIQNAINS
jgi:N-formylglutamate amidohydrolase